MSIYTAQECNAESKEWCVYENGIPIHGPCSEQEARGVKDAKERICGVFSGNIISIESGFATQKTSQKEDSIVWHDVSMLSKLPEVGASEDISYKDGCGVVKERDLGQGGNGR